MLKLVAYVVKSVLFVCRTSNPDYLNNVDLTKYFVLEEMPRIPINTKG
jgi:hypothetical protein